MLRRSLILIVLLASSLAAQVKKPDILVIVEDGPSQDIRQALTKLGWQSAQGSYLTANDAAQRQAALHYGVHPLITGVITAGDWRRSPAQQPNLVSLGESFGKQNYFRDFYGATHFELQGFSHSQPLPAGERDNLVTPFNLSKTNCDQSQHILPLTKTDKARLTVMAAGRYLTPADLAKKLPELAASSANLIILHLDLTNNPPAAYHRSASWHLYGKKLPAHGFSTVKVGWQLYHALLGLIGVPAPAAVTNPPQYFFHSGKWPMTDPLEKHRHQGSLVIGERFSLVNGIDLYPTGKNMLPDLTNQLDLAAHQAEHITLLSAHTKWWQKAHAAMKNPRAYSIGKNNNEPLHLTAMDWRPAKMVTSSGKIPAYKAMVGQQELLDTLRGLKENKDYLETFPAYSGSWPLRITRAGRYKITASLLPTKYLTEKQKPLAKLKAGTAYINLGKNKVQLRIHPGATVITVETDADVGAADLECYFTGQLRLDRELGAFFVTIERTGEKKFNFKPKAK